MSIDTVKAYLAQWDAQMRVMELPASSATVAEAAQALGTEEKRIAKTMSFLVAGEPVLIVIAGDARVNNSLYKAQFHEKAVMLHGEEVEKLTGHPIGGVCPFANPENVTVYLDASLRRFETVFPACGSRNSAIELTLEELERFARIRGWVDVCKDWQ